MDRRIFFFFLIMFAIGTDTFLIAPLLPVLRKNLGVPLDISGWMVGAYAVGYALSALVAGPLSDGWNRKKVMEMGMLSFAVSTILCGFAFDFWSMAAFRFLAGVSAAFVSPQVWAVIPTIVAPGKVIKAMGLATAGLSVAQFMGVPLGSWLALSDWSLPFWTLGGLSCILVLFIHYGIQDIAPHERNSGIGFVFSRYRTLFEIQHARTAFFSYFLFQLGNFATFSFIGTYFADQFHMTLSAIGTAMMILGAGNLAGSLLGGAVVRRLGIHRTLLSGTVVLILIYMFIPHLTSAGLVKGAFFLVFFLGGVLFPVMMGSLQKLSATLRGTIASLSSSLMYFGAAAGSYAAGNLYAYFSGFLAVTLLTTVCFIGYFFIILRESSQFTKAEPMGSVPQQVSGQPARLK